MADPSSPTDISVIVAAYNVENYIERAIRSALDQCEVNVEVIVINDASTDQTLAVASGVNDPRVTCISLPSNSGPSVARNTGFAAASAPWLAVLDGDDAFAPGRLVRCITRAQSTNADIVVDNIEVRREADNKRFPMFNPVKFARMDMLDLATFIRGNLFVLGGATLGYLKPIFSVQFLQRHELNYDPEIRIGEDYMLLAEALACNACCAVESSCGYLYTVRDGSMSHRLSVADITRIVNGDKKFVATHTLGTAERIANERRRLSLNEALAFTKLMDTVKRKDILGALKIVSARPTAALYLWRPVWIRIQNLFR